MKKLVCMTLAMAMTAALFVACNNDGDDEDTPPAAPTIAMDGADIDAVHEIVDGMTVKVQVAAPATISGFEVDIDSPVLTEEMLASVGLTKKFDLTKVEGAMATALKGLGFPVADQVTGQASLAFDISTLIPLIAMLPPQMTSDHNFKLTVTDAKNQSTVKTLKFHLTGPQSVAYNNDANLWTNTATLSVKNLIQGATVQYRVKGTQTWNDAVAEGDGYSIIPIWESSKNAAGLDIHKVKAGTGVFAATTYQCRITDGTETLTQIEFTTAAGDAIPNGNMSGWSKRIWVDASNTKYPITYPNPEGEKMWDSGNNAFLEQYNEDGTPQLFMPLCQEDETVAGAALLSARMVLDFVFAPGNMFTGDFDYTGFSGTVKFGKTYGWTARPRALKVRYKAQVGTIDKLGSNDPDKDDYKDQPDRSRIFVAVVDWTAQHGVTSGMTAPTGMWDPATMKHVDEGAILGYGDLIITQTVTDWVEATLPISWYVENAAKPVAANHSLVISCATSLRGDYLTGCSTNFMLVDDFEWVY